jgi:endonuclease-3
MIAKVISLLKKEYTYDEFARVNRNDPFRVLISCILSLRTKDVVTYKASQRLFRLAKTPKQILRVSAKRIEKAIYPVGFYRVKARTILEICKRLAEEYNSRVPDSIEELLKFKGVGRKTANIVITFGYNKQGIAVDTHVHRISNRLGWVRTKSPEETEFALRKIIPRRYWIPLNELLVRYGQRVCTPISPWCSRCIIRKYCKRVNVKKWR